METPFSRIQKLGFMTPQERQLWVQEHAEEIRAYAKKHGKNATKRVYHVGGETINNLLRQEEAKMATAKSTHEKEETMATVKSTGKGGTHKMQYGSEVSKKRYGLTEAKIKEELADVPNPTQEQIEVARQKTIFEFSPFYGRRTMLETTRDVLKDLGLYDALRKPKVEEEPKVGPGNHLEVLEGKIRVLESVVKGQALRIKKLEEVTDVQE